jgi:DNA polymerase III subunit beta
MKFRCSRERLLSGLQTVGSVVSTRGMKPVYESVLILSRDGQLQLHGTDLEVAIRYYLADDSLKVEEQGSLVVPAARLTSILKEVGDEEVDFSWSDHVLSVDCERSHFRVNGLPAEEFPEIPDFPERESIKLPSHIFERLVARSAFAAAREKMRYALNGVLFLLKGELLQMVGTDGRRLAYAASTVSNPENTEIKAIVPTKGISQMARIISGDEEIDLSIKDNQLAARRSVDGRCRSNPRGGWLVNNETPSFDYCNTNSL